MRRKTDKLEAGDVIRLAFYCEVICGDDRQHLELQLVPPFPPGLTLLSSALLQFARPRGCTWAAGQVHRLTFGWLVDVGVPAFAGGHRVIQLRLAPHFPDGLVPVRQTPEADEINVVEFGCEANRSFELYSWTPTAREIEEAMSDA
jgi:hypothetical protein